MTRFPLIVFLLLAPSATRAAEPAVTLARIESPNVLMLFHPEEKPVLRYHLRDGSGREQRAAYRFRLMDWSGKPLAERTGTALIPANGEAVAVFAMDTHEFRYGVFRLLFRVTPGNGPAFERESYIGITSRTKLRKARDGEFLYGLDAQLGDPPPDSPLYRWMEAMGVDIVRCGYNWDVDPAYVRKQQAVFADHGLRALSLFDPPKTQDPAERKAQLERKCTGLEAIAREHPQMVYWELGNEPDLDFFYPGPIDNYAQDFAAMSRAIHRGNPRAVVMNGGLCYVGDKGRERARRFVQVVDPKALDAFAYHGHGPGAKAERAAWVNMRRTAQEFGRGDKLLVETESGVAARAPEQEMMQTRTAVQKLVFGQSVKMPFFIWFRLLMFEEDYGNLHDREGLEPRPAVLAYRATVEALRGYRFRKVLETGVPDVEAFLFQKAGGKGRCCVLWTALPVTRTVSLSLGVHPASLRRRDMFGNATPIALSPDGTAQVDVSEAPVFLVWETSQGVDAVRPARPAVRAPDTAQVVEDGASTFTVSVRNPAAHPAALDVRLSAGPGVPVTVTPPGRRVLLRARGAGTVSFTLRSGAAVPGVQWPAAWTVFRGAGLAPDALARLTAIPDRLPGAEARRVMPVQGVVDFMEPGQPLAERRPAMVMAEVVSDAERTVKMGASADWWMEWTLNAKTVFSTMETGNGAISGPTDHVFALPLRKGRNLLAARVLSGSQGWKLLVASPAEVAQARSGRGAGCLILTAQSGGRLLARQSIEVQQTAPVPPLGAVPFTAPIGAWEREAPTAVLGGSSVHNEFAKQPDAALWWKGDADLSAVLWLRYDPRRLYLVAKVLDDKDATGADPATMWRNDSLQVAFAGRGRAAYNEYVIGRIDGAVTVYKHAADGGAPVGRLPADGQEIQAAIEPGAGATVYRVSLDRRALGGAECALNALVNDDDGNGRKQFAEWMPGLGQVKDPSLWRRVVLPTGGAKP